MPIWKRFWKTTAFSAVAGAVLYTLVALTNIGGDYAGGWFGAWITLRVLPTTFALLLPLTALAGGISAGRMEALHQSRARNSRVAIAITTGVVAFMLLAYVSPWLETLTLRVALSGSGAGAQGTSTVNLWHRHYSRALALIGTASPGDLADVRREAYAFGWNFYLPMVGGALAAILSGIGLLIGATTRTLARPSARIHEWSAGFALILLIVSLYRGGRLLSLHNAVPPEYLVGVAPAAALLVLLALSWIRIVERSE